MSSSPLLKMLLDGTPAPVTASPPAPSWATRYVESEPRFLMVEPATQEPR